MVLTYFLCSHQKKYATNLLSPSIQRYCSITKVSWYVKLPVTQLFIQLFVQANNKEIIKAPYYWSVLLRGTTSDLVDSFTKGGKSYRAMVS